MHDIGQHRQGPLGVAPRAARATREGRPAGTVARGRCEERRQEQREKAAARRRRLAHLGGLLVLLGALPSAAELRTIRAESRHGASGRLWTVTATYDTNTRDINPMPKIGRYPTLTGRSLRIEQHPDPITSHPPLVYTCDRGNVSVTHDFGFYDTFEVRGLDCYDSGLNPIYTAVLEVIYGLTTEGLTSAEIPLSFPPLRGPELFSWGVSVHELPGVVPSLQLGLLSIVNEPAIPVPEPSPALAGVVALAAVFVLARRGRE